MDISNVPDLSVPEAAILSQAKGDSLAALKLAAAFGYRLACRDLDQIGRATERKEAR
jgi:hypothetical protein